MLVTELIGDALRYINVVNYDAAIPDQIIRRGVAVLNDILNEWGAARVYIPNQTKLILPMVTNQQSYTIGESVSYDLNTAQLISVLEVAILDSTAPGVVWPVRILTEQFYNNIGYLNAQAIPSAMLFRNFDEYSELFFQPVPYKNTLSARLLVKQRLAEVQIGDEINVPRNYHLAMKLRLAQLAGGIWGKMLTAQQEKYADEAVKSMLASNSHSWDTGVRKSEMLNQTTFPFFNFWANN